MEEQEFKRDIKKLIADLEYILVENIDCDADYEKSGWDKEEEMKRKLMKAIDVLKTI